MNLKIDNLDGLPIEYIMAEIAQVEKEKGRKVTRAVFTRIDGENCKQLFEFEKEPFEHIRRITGYLTGDTSTWNEAKKAELADRVKHA